MLGYSFVLKWDGQSNEVRWTYFATDAAARSYGHILARGIRTERKHRHDPDVHMVLTNGDCKEVASIPVF